MALLTTIVLSISIAFFIWPSTDATRRSDAIVVLGGYGPERIARGLSLARAGYAPNLVVSTPGRRGCPRPMASIRVVCFVPSPLTTQGEARFVATLAGHHHWHQIIVIPTTPQATRARIRFERCYRGTILMDPADPRGVTTWLYDIAYEWGAVAKALTVQRGC